MRIFLLIFHHSVHKDCIKILIEKNNPNPSPRYFIRTVSFLIQLRFHAPDKLLTRNGCLMCIHLNSIPIFNIFAVNYLKSFVGRSVQKLIQKLFEDGSFNSCHNQDLIRVFVLKSDHRWCCRRIESYERNLGKNPFNFFNGNSTPVRVCVEMSKWNRKIRRHVLNETVLIFNTFPVESTLHCVQDWLFVFIR